MKVLKFTYNKNGEISNREVIPLESPSNLLSGIEISNLNGDSKVAFMQEVAELLDAQRDALQQVLVNHSMSGRYRCFKETNIFEMEKYFVTKDTCQELLGEKV